MEKQKRTHRVGSYTAGISMIVFGTLFILRLFVDFLSYEFIIKLWPFMMIGIGVEILISNFSNRRFVYDKGAVCLMFLIMLFAVFLAGADMCITYLDLKMQMPM